MAVKIADWVKQYKTEVLMTAVFTLFPLLCALCWCLWEGHFIGDVYLPVSYWNDELMYYKQVEALVEHGLPVGYFGFNECHGILAYFGAWSPVILLPWYLWGLLFGWNLTSPVYANIVYAMLCGGGFYLLARPGKKQSVWILALLAVFTPYTRYLLSGMPESLFMAFTMLFLGCAAAWQRREKRKYLIAMFIIAVLLSMARPYLLLFLLLPVFFCIRHYGSRGAIVSILVFLATAAGYFVIAKYSTSPYLEPIVDAGWLGIFPTEGVWAGIKYVFQTLYEKLGILFTDYLKRGVKYGLFSGALYAVTGLLAALAAMWLGILYIKRERSENRWLYWHYCISVAGMILALFLFYRMGEGSKHLMCFVVLGILLFGLEKKRALLPKILILAACGYFFIWKVYAPYDWQVSYDDGVMGAEAERLEIQADENLILEKGADPYDNTIIWLASDVIDGQSVPATWGLLYAMPAGFGINFCTQEYVSSHFEELHSAYIALLPGGEIEKMALEHGWIRVAGTERMALYRRKPD